MHRMFLGFVFAAFTGCTQVPEPDLQQRVDDAAREGKIDFTRSVDVSEDGMPFVGYEQSPDGANPYQPTHIYCFGEDSPGWQGNGCWTALPVYDPEGNFQGFAQVLPPDGLFRMGFGNAPVTDASDDSNWFDHSVGVDTKEEWQWVLEFWECGVRKLNLCVRMIDGHAEPDLAACAALHVPPPCN